MLTLKEHHEREITKGLALGRLEEIRTVHYFMQVRGVDYEYDGELEDINQLKLEASYEWEEL